MKNTACPIEEMPAHAVFPKSIKSAEPARRGRPDTQWESITVTAPSGVQRNGYMERSRSKRIHFLHNTEWRALSLADLTEVAPGSFCYAAATDGRSSRRSWRASFNGLTWRDMPSQSVDDEVAKKLLFALYRKGVTTPSENHFINRRRQSLQQTQ